MIESVSNKARQKESINDLEANEANHSLVFDDRRVRVFKHDKHHKLISFTIDSF
jgi:hypothetical protein